jgi:acetyl/propionyl-CoA carboxylase alpha subunit
LGQEQVRRLGHALECRIYAEDPTRDDAPSPGTILLWVAPEGPGVRVDSGVATGSEVSVHYDPMLAKLVTWGQNRGESLQRMRSALLRTVVLGVATNVERLGEILAHPRFVEGALHTGFIQEHLQATEPATPPPALAVAAAVAALRGRPTSTPVGGGPALPDPWELVGPWRLS